MGPFQHKVDHGLDNRKLAFECVISLYDKMPNRFDLNEFTKQVVQGFTDPSLDIKLTSHSLLIRICEKHPLSVPPYLEQLIPALKAAIFVVTKETAVKQEIENNKSLVLSGIKVFKALDPLVQTPEWTALHSEIIAPSSPVASLYKKE